MFLEPFGTMHQEQAWPGCSWNHLELCTKNRPGLVVPGTIWNYAPRAGLPWLFLEPFRTMHQEQAWSVCSWHHLELCTKNRPGLFVPGTINKEQACLGCSWNHGPRPYTSHSQSPMQPHTEACIPHTHTPTHTHTQREKDTPINHTHSDARATIST